jgi:hypothetical protein
MMQVYISYDELSTFLRNTGTRQPALARAIDVGVADAAKPEVAADVDIPGVHIRIDPVVVAMRLVGNALWGAEVHPAGHGLPGLVVNHCRADPVPARCQRGTASHETAATQ